MRLWFLFVLIVFAVPACNNFPRDPDKTLEKIQKGTMVVGYSENSPWVIKTKTNPIGLEADLVNAFAKSQGTKITWVNDTEQDLFEKLEKRELQIVICGITDKNTWKSKVSFTRPYFKLKKEKHVMAVLKGENAFVVALEKFLHQQESNLNTRLAAYETH